MDPEKVIFRHIEVSIAGFRGLQGEHAVRYVDEAERKNTPKSSEEVLEVHRGSCQDRIDRISISTPHPLWK